MATVGEVNEKLVDNEQNQKESSGGPPSGVSGRGEGENNAINNDGNEAGKTP